MGRLLERLPLGEGRVSLWLKGGGGGGAFAFCFGTEVAGGEAATKALRAVKMKEKKKSSLHNSSRCYPKERERERGNRFQPCKILEKERGSRDYSRGVREAPLTTILQVPKKERGSKHLQELHVQTALWGRRGKKGGFSFLTRPKNRHTNRLQKRKESKERAPSLENFFTPMGGDLPKGERSKVVGDPGEKEKGRDSGLSKPT